MKEIIISLEALSDISGKDIKLSKYDEVVTRCKDCVHYTGLNDSATWGRCHAHGRTCQDCDYCSWAERKEE